MAVVTQSSQRERILEARNRPYEARVCEPVVEELAHVRKVAQKLGACLGAGKTDLAHWLQRQISNQPRAVGRMALGAATTILGAVLEGGPQVATQPFTLISGALLGAAVTGTIVAALDKHQQRSAQQGWNRDPSSAYKLIEKSLNRYLGANSPRHQKDEVELMLEISSGMPNFREKDFRRHLQRDPVALEAWDHYLSPHLAAQTRSLSLEPKAPPPAQFGKALEQLHTAVEQWTQPEQRPMTQNHVTAYSMER